MNWYFEKCLENDAVRLREYVIAQFNEETSRKTLFILRIENVPVAY